VLPKRQAAAQRLFKQGIAHFVQSRYLQAVTALQRALTLWDHPAIRFNLAVCFMELGRNKEAYGHLTRALKGGKTLLGDKWEEARRYHRLLRQRVARLRIQCDSPGAVVSLDGKKLFTGPGSMELVVRPGRHQLLATRSKYVTVSRDIYAQAGKHQAFRIKLLKGERAFCFRAFYRYHWGVPVSASVGAVAALAAGIALVVRGRSIVSDTEKDVRAAFVPIPGTTGMAASEVRDLEKQGRNLQGGGYGLLAASGLLTAASVVLWLFWKKQVDVKKNESLLSVPF
jgi:hypothetical protein